MEIAEREKTDLTHIIRDALQLYANTKREQLANGGSTHPSIPGEKIEDYLEHPGSLHEPARIDGVLKPCDLDLWSEEILLRYAKHLRSRKEEVDSALRRRGFYIRW